MASNWKKLSNGVQEWTGAPLMASIGTATPVFPPYTPDQEEVLDLLADEIFANMDDGDWHDAEEAHRMMSLYEQGTLLPEDLQ